jgi:hypothetical protein
VLANSAIEFLTDGVASELLEPPVNGLRATLYPDGMAPRILNFDEWSGHLLHRLEREATGDEELATLRDELLTYPGVQAEPPRPESVAAAEIVLPLELRHGDGRLSFFGTLTTFGTPTDVTLAELSLEAFYPANAATAEALAARGSDAALRYDQPHGAWRSLVSALVWGTRGPRFKSGRPDE